MVSKMIYNFFLASLFLGQNYYSTDFKCGEKKQVDRPYGQVTLEVDCHLMKRKNSIVAFEYKGEIGNGFQMHFDSIWRRKDSVFLINNKLHGVGLEWDSLGNIIGKEFYKNGIQTGKSEQFYSPNQPSKICNFNAKGKLDGKLQEWWKNGNKKTDARYRNGMILEEKTFFENGKPATLIKYQNSRTEWNDDYAKLEQYQKWDSIGNSIAQIKEGNGIFKTDEDGYITYYEKGKRKIGKTEALDRKIKMEDSLYKLSLNLYYTWAKIVQNDEDISKRGNLDVNVQLTDSVTPLHMACDLGKINLIRQLVQAGAKINVADQFGSTPIAVCVARGNKPCVEFLLANHADLNFREGRAFYSSFFPILMAMDTNKIDLVRLLIKSGADVNVQGFERQSPLHVAAMKGNEELIDLLVTNKANLYIKDEDGETPLDWAMKCKRNEATLRKWMKKYPQSNPSKSTPK